jgi:hypothetical protein
MMRTWEKNKTHTHTHTQNKTKQNWWEPIRLHFQHTQKQESNQPTPNLQENLLKTQNQISQLGEAAAVFEASRRWVVALAWRAASAVT